MDGWKKERRWAGTESATGYRVNHSFPQSFLRATERTYSPNAGTNCEESTYKRIEIIVVDNGSVEEATRELLSSRELQVVRMTGISIFRA